MSTTIYVLCRLYGGGIERLENYYTTYDAALKAGISKMGKWNFVIVAVDEGTVDQ